MECSSLFLINQEEDLLAERVFTPATDLIKLLREKNLPLWSLENRRPLHEFDVIAVHFSQNWELQTY